MRSLALVLGLAAVLAAGSASAQSVQVATNAGFTYDLVYSRGPNGNFYTGSSSGQIRSFLTFSVPVSVTPFTSAVLNLNVATVEGGPNDLAVYDVTSNIATDPVGKVAADLESGTLFGTATGLNSGDTVQITLNAAGLAAVNAARGGEISFGFVNSTNGGGIDGIFSQSGGSSPRELILTPTAVAPTPVPTMSEWAMILFAAVMAGGAALYIQRRRQVV